MLYLQLCTNLFASHFSHLFLVETLPLHHPLVVTLFSNSFLVETIEDSLWTLYWRLSSLHLLLLGPTLIVTICFASWSRFALPSSLLLSSLFALCHALPLGMMLIMTSIVVLFNPHDPYPDLSILRFHHEPKPHVTSIFLNNASLYN